MKKNKLFIACDSTSKKNKKLLNILNDKLIVGYNSIEFLNSKNGRKYISN